MRISRRAIHALLGNAVLAGLVLILVGLDPMAAEFGDYRDRRGPQSPADGSSWHVVLEVSP